MPYAEVRNFSRGLDSRSHHLTAEPGSLETLTNGHITRGGDIEKRKAFTVHKALPAGTFGMETTLSDGLVVFGSGTDPGVPSGVTYQRLQHPGGSAMTELVFSTVFSGKTWALAKFADGLTLGFYDGELIADFHIGVVRADHSALSDVVTEIADAINASTAYEAASDGNTITINAGLGEAFTATGTATNVSGGTDDQVITITTVSEAASSISETVPTADLTISGESGTVDKIDIGSVTVFSGFQKEEITCVADVADSLDGTYFRLNDSAGSVGVWIDVDNSGTSEPSGSSALDRSLEVTGITTGMSASSVATQIASTIDGDSMFSASASGSMVTVTHSTAGDKTDGMDGDTGFGTPQIETITCVADVSGSLDGTYFTLYDSAGSVGVWIDVDDSGTTVPAGATASARQIEITSIATDDTASEVASAIATDLGADSEFAVTTDGATIAITQVVPGDVGDAADGDTGFTDFTVTQNGSTTFNVRVNGAGDWVASNSNTASALASAINNYEVEGTTVGAVTITDPGNYLLAAPTVTFSAPGPGGTTATGYAVTETVNQFGNYTIANNNTADFDFHRVTSIVITNAGSGYTTPPSITFSGSYVNFYRYYYGEAWAFATTDPQYTVRLDASGEPTQYTAEATGARVRISGAAGTGTSANGNAVDVDVDGTSTNTSANITVTHDSTISGGVEAVAGSRQFTEAVFSGTLDEGDTFSITLTDSALQDRVFGGSRVASIDPVAAKTLKQKVYMAADSLLYFSETAVPTSWQDDDFGSGVINITENFGGSAPLTGIGTYQNQLAVFSRRSTQIWYVDPDDALNQQIQTIDNIGALSPLSVVSLGDSDVFFVSDSGIRSLRVRDSSGNAAVTDVGTPIDTLVIDDLADLTEAEKKAIPAVYEPIDGRYWVVINGKIYVYSWFPGSRIAAWSQYTPEYDASGTLTTMGTISKMVALNDRIYLRAGNNIFIYGGSDNATYDASVCTAVIPYLSMGESATDKKINALDVAVDGTWDISTNTNPSAPTAWQSAGTADESTFATQSFRASGLTTHTKVKLATTGSEAAKVSSVIVHYRKEKAG